jgi:hypothetical protein
MLNTLGIFDLSALTNEERLNYSDKRHYFWFGEVGMASMLAGVFAVPVGIFLAGRAEITLAFIGAAVLFLPLFVFLPKVMQQAMKADADVVIEAFGRNQHVKKVFLTLFVVMAGVVLARVVDPVSAQQVVGINTGMGAFGRVSGTKKDSATPDWKAGPTRPLRNPGAGRSRVTIQP